MITADFVYFRLRKADYTGEDRAAIWEKSEGLLAEGKTVFLFFKHEDSPAGALYAEALSRKFALTLLGSRGQDRP